ncbi:MAG: O-antigen ligase family protein [Flavobacteriales bacterium]|nr:O-antigen ligase family protein [Flavobacteriales bacterium]
MLLSKRKLINNLFVLAFPFYGLGMYRGYKGNFSEGLIVAVLPFIMILALHLLDLMYQRQFRSMVNRVYWVGLAFLLSLVSSMWIAFMEGFPGLNMLNMVAYMILYLAPFHAAIVVQIRNRGQDDFDFAKLLLKGLSLLIVFNLLGVALGMQNVVHKFEGRINLPFLRGIYDAAHLMSVVNLMLLFYLKDFVRKPGAFLLTLSFYMVNLALMVNVNSRLSFLMFLVLTVLFLFRIIRTVRLLFPISLFTMPILVNAALLVYWILTLPIFAAVVSRVDKEDVTTFNNRTYVWEEAWNWLLDDRRGFFFGNGHQGQYKLPGWEAIGKIFMVRHSYDVHMHSTFLQTVISQGVVGYVLFILVMWYIYKHYRTEYMKGTDQAPLYAAVVYLLFIWQIDIICYGIDLGNPLVFCILSAVAIDPRYITRRPKALGGEFLE